jgi:hypothetical protein
MLMATVPGGLPWPGCTVAARPSDEAAPARVALGSPQCPSGAMPSVHADIDQLQQVSRGAGPLPDHAGEPAQMLAATASEQQHHRRVGDRQDAPFRDEAQVRDRALLAADRVASKRPTALKPKRRRRRKSVLLRTRSSASAARSETAPSPRRSGRLHIGTTRASLAYEQRQARVGGPMLAGR